MGWPSPCSHQTVPYKTRTGPGLVIKRGPGLFIKHGLNPSHGLHVYNDYRATKSDEILMFFCLQKDAKQCCDATKMGCTYCSG